MLALLAAGYGLRNWWPDSRRDILRALETDVSAFDGAAIERYVRALPVERMTYQEKLAVLDKLRARVLAMDLAEQMQFFRRIREVMETEPRNPLVIHGRELMNAAFDKQLADYVAADAAAPKKLLDQQIDQQILRENMRKLAAGARSLLGGGNDSGANSQPVRPPPSDDQNRPASWPTRSATR